MNRNGGDDSPRSYRDSPMVYTDPQQSMMTPNRQNPLLTPSGFQSDDPPPLPPYKSNALSRVMPSQAPISPNAPSVRMMHPLLLQRTAGAAKFEDDEISRLEKARLARKTRAQRRAMSALTIGIIVVATLLAILSGVVVYIAYYLLNGQSVPGSLDIGGVMTADSIKAKKGVSATTVTASSSMTAPTVYASTMELDESFQIKNSAAGFSLGSVMNASSSDATVFRNTKVAGTFTAGATQVSTLSSQSQDLRVAVENGEFVVTKGGARVMAIANNITLSPLVPLNLVGTQLSFSTLSSSLLTISNTSISSPAEITVSTPLLRVPNPVNLSNNDIHSVSTLYTRTIGVAANAPSSTLVLDAQSISLPQTTVMLSRSTSDMKIASIDTSDVPAATGATNGGNAAAATSLLIIAGTGGTGGDAGATGPNGGSGGNGGSLKFSSGHGGNAGVGTTLCGNGGNAGNIEFTIGSPGLYGVSGVCGAGKAGVDGNPGSMQIKNANGRSDLLINFYSFTGSSVGPRTYRSTVMSFDEQNPGADPKTVFSVVVSPLGASRSFALKSDGVTNVEMLPDGTVRFLRSYVFVNNSVRVGANSELFDSSLRMYGSSVVSATSSTKASFANGLLNTDATANSVNISAASFGIRNALTVQSNTLTVNNRIALDGSGSLYTDTNGAMTLANTIGTLNLRGLDSVVTQTASLIHRATNVYLDTSAVYLNSTSSGTTGLVMTPSVIRSTDQSFILDAVASSWTSTNNVSITATKNIFISAQGKITITDGSSLGMTFDSTIAGSALSVNYKTAVITSTGARTTLASAVTMASTLNVNSTIGFETSTASFVVNGPANRISSVNSSIDFTSGLALAAPNAPITVTTTNSLTFDVSQGIRLNSVATGTIWATTASSRHTITLGAEDPSIVFTPASLKMSLGAVEIYHRAAAASMKSTDVNSLTVDFTNAKVSGPAAIDLTLYSASNRIVVDASTGLQLKNSATADGQKITALGSTMEIDFKTSSMKASTMTIETTAGEYKVTSSNGPLKMMLATGIVQDITVGSTKFAQWISPESQTVTVGTPFVASNLYGTVTTQLQTTQASITYSHPDPSGTANFLVQNTNLNAVLLLRGAKGVSIGSAPSIANIATSPDRISGTGIYIDVSLSATMSAYTGPLNLHSSQQIVAKIANAGHQITFSVISNAVGMRTPSSIGIDIKPGELANLQISGGDTNSTATSGLTAGGVLIVGGTAYGGATGGTVTIVGGPALGGGITGRVLVGNSDQMIRLANNRLRINEAGFPFAFMLRPCSATYSPSTFPPTTANAPTYSGNNLNTFTTTSSTLLVMPCLDVANNIIRAEAFRGYCDSGTNCD